MFELAIVLPILLIVLFAIAEISIALYDKAVLTKMPAGKGQEPIRV